MLGIVKPIERCRLSGQSGRGRKLFPFCVLLIRFNTASDKSVQSDRRELNRSLI